MGLLKDMTPLDRRLYNKDLRALRRTIASGASTYVQIKSNAAGDGEWRVHVVGADTPEGRKDLFAQVRRMRKSHISVWGFRLTPNHDKKT